MENPAQENFNDKVRERTMKMSVEVYNLLAGREVSPISRTVVSQLIRSSSSVAANYRAATRSRSDSEFYSKICIVVEECDETLFWFDYLSRTRIVAKDEIRPLWQDVDELVRLFSSIKQKMKEKLGK